jgi:hypothetical protein
LEIHEVGTVKIIRSGDSSIALADDGTHIVSFV